MTDKPFLQRLDDLAKLTGVPGIQPPRRRPLRGLAVITLVLGTAGMIIASLGQSRFWIGEAVLMVGFAASGWLQIFGPIKPWMTEKERVDERDEAIRAQAYLAALPVILIAGTFGLAGLPALAFLQHRNALETLALGGLGSIYLMLLWASIPTLHASWNVTPSEDD